jgi:hypothetical protein
MANIGDKFLFDLDLNYLSHPYDPSVILECNLDPNLFLLTGTTNYAYQNGKTMWGLYNIGYEYISANTINSEITPLVQFTAINNSGGTIDYNPAIGNFDFSGTPVHDYYFKPAIQAKELYEAIVREAGYIVESNFFETAYFQKFYMPLKFVDETIYSRNAIPPCYTYTNTSIIPTPSTPTYTNPSENVLCNTLGYTATTTTLTIPAVYQGDYTFRFTFQLNPTEPFCDFDTFVYPNISFIFTDGIQPPVTLYQNTICDGTLTTVSFDQAFNLTGSSNLSFYFQGEYIEVDQFQFQIIQGPRFIPIGSEINYDIEFPENDYKQIDYITSVNKYFNLVVVPNPDKPTNLIIEPIIDYIGKGEVLDWTTKIDFAQTQNLYPTTALLNGTLEYDFKLDQDYANQDFNSQTNRIFGTDKVKLGLEYKDATTKFSYIFSSPIDITLNNAYVPIITMNSMSKLKQVDLSGVTQQTFVPFKILPKLTFRGLTLPVDNYGFVGGSGTTLGDPSCVSGYTLNVTDPGWIKWANCEGIQTYLYVYNGTNVLPGCINSTSVNVGFPFADLAVFTVSSSGTICAGPVGPVSVYQYWYMDSAQQDRFTNINRFTTYPFNYTGFSHYINFRGEDQSNITPAEFSFVAKDLYNIYYEPYVQDLISEENKVYAAKIYLYPQDIQKLRWNEKILINNTYFRINKITNFNALEPAICDIELVKLTKEYLGHPKLFYDLIPCSSGETLHTNSDIMYNLYAYAGNYVTLYDTSLSYLGCYGVTVVDEDPNVNYEKFWIGTAYTSNLVGVYSDCGCSGRTEFDIVQEEPGEDRLFFYSALDCATSATTYSFKSTNADLLTGTTSYKIYNTGTTETVCVFNPRPTFIQNTSWQYLSAYTDCAECLFVPPTPTPSVTPSNTPTPSITPTISVTPSITSSPTPTSNPYCYTIQASQSIPGECFDCPNTYPSVTDWYINFYNGCGGTQILPPFDMNVVAYYSDGSTQVTFIPAGGTGVFFIASSNVQCGFPPECAEVASPTFEYANVIPVLGGTINECCSEPTPTPTSVTPTPTSQTPTPTPTPSVTPAVGDKSLELRVLDIASTPQTITMFYSINGGGNINIPGGTSVIFPITCTLLYTISGLTSADVVIFGTSINCAMEGAGGTGCPGFVGSLTTYSYVVDAPTVQTLSLTIDTQDIP